MKYLQKDFVPYELALRMKQLGFDEPCMASRDMNNDENLIQIPLYQQAFRWFRDEHGMSGSIQIEHDAYQWSIFKEGETSGLASDNWDGTDYEEAELACLEKLLEIVEQNGKDKSET